jgi:hypothetical protein
MIGCVKKTTYLKNYNVIVYKTNYINKAYWKYNERL